MTQEELDALGASDVSPTMPRKRGRPRKADSAESVNDAATPAKPPVKEKRMVPVGDEAEFNKAIRPYKPMASIITKLYNRILREFEVSELDDDEKEFMTTGTSAMMYEHIHEASGTMIFLTALAATAVPRAMEYGKRKALERKNANSRQTKTLTLAKEAADSSAH